MHATRALLLTTHERCFRRRVALCACSSLLYLQHCTVCGWIVQQQQQRRGTAFPQYEILLLADTTTTLYAILEYYTKLLHTSGWWMANPGGLDNRRERYSAACPGRIHCVSAVWSACAMRLRPVFGALCASAGLVCLREREWVIEDERMEYGRQMERNCAHACRDSTRRSSCLRSACNAQVRQRPTNRGGGTL